jgi:hypothetical protein
MACSKLEDTALLYSSRELNEADAKSFEQHLETCDECRHEMDLYRKEQKHYYSPEIFSESPSEATNREILRVCSDARKQITNTGFIPLFFKKTVFSMTFFVVGFIVVGYFAMNIENSKQQNQDMALQNTSIDSTTLSEADKEKVVSQRNVDSINDTNLYYSKTRGNLDVNGVFPVDLKK